MPPLPTLADCLCRSDAAICRCHCRRSDNRLFYLPLSSTKGPWHWSNASRLMAAQQAVFLHRPTQLRGQREERGEGGELWGSVGSDSRWEHRPKTDDVGEKEAVKAAWWLRKLAVIQAETSVSLTGQNLMGTSRRNMPCLNLCICSCQRRSVGLSELHFCKVVSRGGKYKNALMNKGTKWQNKIGLTKQGKIKGTVCASAGSHLGEQDEPAQDKERHKIQIRTVLGNRWTQSGRTN